MQIYASEKFIRVDLHNPAVISWENYGWAKFRVNPRLLTIGATKKHSIFEIIKERSF